MPLSLPPLSIIRTDAQTIDHVNVQLTSVIVGHVGAKKPWTFYEEIDHWLGPWGNNGYPIAYGKFYCVAFNSNEKLQQNGTTRRWVLRATLRLQELLRDYIVSCLKSNNLAGLSETKLRQAAFESHPKAYDEGGLALVVNVAPELIPFIGIIPWREYSPTSESFNATVRQALDTAGKIAPKVMGTGLATIAGTAHTGVFRIAIARDRQRFMGEIALSKELGFLRRSLQQGRLDHVPWLDRIIRALNMREFTNQAFIRLAREILSIARNRRVKLIGQYSSSLENSPEIKKTMSTKFPMLFSDYSQHR